MLLGSFLRGKNEEELSRRFRRVIGFNVFDGFADGDSG
jgi:hypothetical protein